MPINRLPAIVVLILAFATQAVADDARTLRVGSKRFTESYVLGEILAESARRAGVVAEHRAGLGNTAIVHAALASGAVDVYPEYTGTIAREILKLDAGVPLEALNARLAPLGLAASVPLGFNNTYAIGVRAAVADELRLRTISDLVRAPDLRFGLSQEFLARADGWPGVRDAYRLPQTNPRGLDHGLAYEALGAGRIDAMDVYSTDAKIRRHAVRVLEDDRRWFPRYDAVLLYRADVPARFPAAWARIAALEGRIDAERMIALNAGVELDARPYAEVARAFVDEQASGQRATSAPAASMTGRGSVWSAIVAPDLVRLTLEHLALAFASLAIAMVAGIPLGIFASRHRAIGEGVLALVGVIQTIPALALLALLIAGMGMIGFWPALVALALYALLPIVRNTHTAISGLAGGLRQAALALGLRPLQRLRYIELPLAWPTILAGIKTAAVINVGTATIAAFVGAGGLGDRIVQGLAVNDTRLLVAGAVPAAVLALLVQWAFDLVEWRSAPWRRVVRG